MSSAVLFCLGALGELKFISSLSLLVLHVMVSAWQSVFVYSAGAVGCGHLAPSPDSAHPAICPRMMFAMTLSSGVVKLVSKQTVLRNVPDQTCFTAAEAGSYTEPWQSRMLFAPYSSFARTMLQRALLALQAAAHSVTCYRLSCAAKVVRDVQLPKELGLQLTMYSSR